jgi:hypothetical protein
MQEGAVFAVLGAKRPAARRHAGHQVIDQGSIRFSRPGKQYSGHIQSGNHFFQHRLQGVGAVPHKVGVQSAHERSRRIHQALVNELVGIFCNNVFHFSNPNLTARFAQDAKKTLFCRTGCLPSISNGLIGISQMAGVGPTKIFDPAGILILNVI